MSPLEFMFITFAVCILLYLPIFVCLGIAAIGTMLVYGMLPIDLMTTVYFSSLDSFPLLAIPFFIFAGNLMMEGGIAKQLVKLGLTLFGHLRGALATATVFSCMIFSSFSGSGSATTAAIGGIMIPAMKEEEYDASFAASLTACSGAMGPIIPPSIMLVVYGVANNVSVGRLFIAGIIPGIMMGLALIFYSYIVCGRKNFGKIHPKAGIKATLLAFKDAIWALFAPIIILGGIYGGFFTPTEAAVIACAYSLFVGIFIYRGIDSWQKFFRVCANSANTIGMCLALMGAASLFGRIMTLERLPATAAAAITAMTSNVYVILLAINIFLLIIGMFMESTAANLVLSPLLLSIVRPLGVDPVHFGIILSINLAIGLCTPPVGLNSFVASKISGVGIGPMLKDQLPMIGCLCIVLLLVTYFPWFALVLLGG